MSELQQGSEKAFECVYHLYKSKLYAFCHRLLSDDELAREIVQETMVRLWESRHRLDAEKSLNAYLYAISRNLVRDHMSRYAREVEMAENLLPEAADTTSALAEISYREIKQIETRVVSRLPPQQREVYQLSRYGQLSNPEIADSMGISVNSVKTHLRLALKALHKHLDPVNDLLMFIIALLILS